MMLDKDLVNNEIERIKLLFLKEKYDQEQKKWFIESKINRAKATNDDLLLEVCERLLEELKNE